MNKKFEKKKILGKIFETNFGKRKFSDTRFLEKKFLENFRAKIFWKKQFLGENIFRKKNFSLNYDPALTQS